MLMAHLLEGDCTSHPRTISTMVMDNGQSDHCLSWQRQSNVRGSLSVQLAPLLQLAKARISEVILQQTFVFALAFHAPTWWLQASKDKLFRVSNFATYLTTTDMTNCPVHDMPSSKKCLRCQIAVNTLFLISRRTPLRQ